MSLSTSFLLRASSTLLAAALTFGAVGCSSDSSDDDDAAGTPCVTVSYYTADGNEDGAGSCVDVPSACSGGDLCGGDDQACDDALAALCESGSSMMGCSSVSIGGSESAEIVCQRD